MTGSTGSTETHNHHRELGGLQVPTYRGSGLNNHANINHILRTLLVLNRKFSILQKFTLDFGISLGVQKISGRGSQIRVKTFSKGN